MNGWTRKRRPRKKGQMIPITMDKKTALAQLRDELKQQLSDGPTLLTAGPDQVAEDLAPTLIAALGRYDAAVVVGLVKTHLQAHDDATPDQVLQEVWPTIASLVS
jgi:fructose-1-phosphate kinase PfkB-like protein